VTRQHACLPARFAAAGAIAAGMQVVIVPDLNQPSDEARGFCLEVLTSLVEADQHFDRCSRSDGELPSRRGTGCRQEGLPCGAALVQAAWMSDKKQPVHANAVQLGYDAEPHAHKTAEQRHLDAPVLQLDLVEELRALRASAAFETRGHAAKTLAKSADLRVVLMAFDRGRRLEQHHAPGRVSIQTVEGHVALKLGEQSLELRTGGLLQLAPQVSHDIEAIEPSAILLTIAWPATAPRGA
jgi:quercetin dioxygenase-like cupin family protein